MQLGAFSISLNVKNIHASKEFYESLGFTQMGGNIDEKWLILRNSDCTVGLFEGMINKNTLTFTPGWDANAKEIQSFTDVRKLQKLLESKGIEVKQKVEGEKGPGYFTITDPDGNPILIDQHV